MITEPGLVSLSLYDIIERVREDFSLNSLRMKSQKTDFDRHIRITNPLPGAKLDEQSKVGKDLNSFDLEREVDFCS